MRWRIWAEPWNDRTNLALVNDGPGYTAQYAVADQGELVWHPVEVGEKIRPLLKLDTRTMTALAQELSGYTQSSDATLDALKDTRVVRDRLLTLIERTSL